MPELPDVENFRQYFNNTSLNKNIKEVDIEAPKMVEDISAKDLRNKLTGKKFISSKRHGKYFFAQITKTQFLVLHFGMTGYLQYGEDEAKVEKHARLICRFTKDRFLAYICQRKFGIISFTDNLEEFISSKKLGFDPIESKLNYKKFEEITEGRSSKIKSLLMDQEIIAGIGNIYADEILYHSGVHPEKSFDELDEKSKKKLVKDINKILEKGIEVNTCSKDFPKNYLTNRRKENEECGLCGGSIKKKKVGGRTSYFCSDHQYK